ncbi:MAG: SixA phosphatase family protein [Pseudomonadota bacterium]
MELLLWRHAEAAEGAVDLARELTARGRRQARQMAHWLDRHGPPGLEVWCSPAVRAQQTAAALGRDARTLDALAPGADAAALLAATPWPDADAAWLLVGHQPALGRLAALVLTGREADWSIRRGAVWWLRSRQRGGIWQAGIYCVQTPELL